MLPRLAKAFQQVIDVASDVVSESTASQSGASFIDDVERPAHNMRTEQVDTPTQTVLGRKFQFMEISSPLEKKHVGSREAGFARERLPGAMVPREAASAAQLSNGRTTEDAPNENGLFFAAVENYHQERIILPSSSRLNDSTERNDSVFRRSGESAGRNSQITNVVEERDKIVAELFRQKSSFEHTIDKLRKQRDDLNAENAALKSSADELRSSLHTSQASVENLSSQNERLEGLLTHEHGISATHQIESESLRRRVAALTQEAASVIAHRDSTIDELKAKRSELEKEIVSLNESHMEEKRLADNEKEQNGTLSRKLSESEALVKKLMSEKNELTEDLAKVNVELKNVNAGHEKEIETLKGQHDIALHNSNTNLEATQKRNAEMETEIQSLKTLLKDMEERAGELDKFIREMKFLISLYLTDERLAESEETAVESEAMTTPDKHKTYGGLGKRPADELDKAESQGKKSRSGHFDHDSDSTRGRPRFRTGIVGRFFRSHSRARTPEVVHSDTHKRKELEEPGTKVLSKSPKDPKTPQKTTFSPESIAPSVSAGSSNNFADDEADIGGTPKIAISSADCEEDYVFLDSSPKTFDPKSNSAKSAASTPDILKGRSLSREPPHLKMSEPVSPTPVRSHKKSPSPFSLPHRPVYTHAATDLPKSAKRALSPTRYASAPSSSSSKKRKQLEPEPDVKKIKSWYVDDEDVVGRQVKRNKAE
ncbi:hypothetical protein BDN70DRAFT_978760 [Pholiota conissans]|uniref:Uncharacterized protein n=1 Tax=Pholiota conissans TaxID=109636 RepID=A0A9P6D1N9_9AGAR|nr:hypothetical protein BDN70DRAFT_978760 [Pholiota conissans]